MSRKELKFVDFFSQFKQIVTDSFFLSPQTLPNNCFELNVCCFQKIYAYVFVSFVNTSTKADKLTDGDLNSFQTALSKVLSDSHLPSISKLSSLDYDVGIISIQNPPKLPPNYQNNQCIKMCENKNLLFGFSVPLLNVQVNDIVRRGLSCFQTDQVSTISQPPNSIQSNFSGPSQDNASLSNNIPLSTNIPLSNIPLSINNSPPILLPKTSGDVFQILEKEKREKSNIGATTPLVYDDVQLRAQLFSLAKCIGSDYSSMVPLNDLDIQQLPAQDVNVNVLGTDVVDKVKKWQDETEYFLKMLEKGS